MSEQARKVKNKNIPQWAQGLYYSSGLMSEVLVYHDDEAIYLEHKGKDSGIVRLTFEMIEEERVAILKVYPLPPKGNKLLTQSLLLFHTKMRATL